MSAPAGSLCSGVGMLDRAIETLFNVRTAWYAEMNPAAATVYAHHWPGLPNLGDITVADWRGVDPVRLLKAGFPCQPFSAAGRGAGSSDERHLWPVAVLPAITTILPPVVVLENVPGLLRIEHGQVWAQILTDLDRLGYTVAWTTVGACKVGACHHRHRLFVLAVHNTTVPAPDVAPAACRQGEVWAPVQDVLFGDTEAVRWPDAGMSRDGVMWSLPADVCGNNGLALLPSPRTSDANGAGAHGAGGPDLRTVIADLTGVAHVDRFGKYTLAVRRHEALFGGPIPDPTVSDDKGGRRLNPAFVEWMMGLPPQFVTGLMSTDRRIPEGMISRGDAMRALGNGVFGPAAVHALMSLPTFGAAQALLASRLLAVAA